MPTNTPGPERVKDPHTGELYNFRPLFDYLHHQQTDVADLSVLLMWAQKYSALAFIHPAGQELEITEIVLQLPNLAEVFRQMVPVK